MNRLHRFFIRTGALAALLAFAPAAFADTIPQTGGLDRLGTELLTIVYFIDRYLVPVIFAIAFIVFVWGIYRTFIAGATSEEKRQEGQKLIVYGLVGFFLMFSVWGIVNLLVGTFGFDRDTRPDLPTFDPKSNNANYGGDSFVDPNSKPNPNGYDATKCPAGTHVYPDAEEYGCLPDDKAPGSTGGGSGGYNCKPGEHVVTGAEEYGCVPIDCDPPTHLDTATGKCVGN